MLFPHAWEDRRRHNFWVTVEAGELGAGLAAGRESSKERQLFPNSLSGTMFTWSSSSPGLLVSHTFNNDCWAK